MLHLHLISVACWWFYTPCLVRPPSDCNHHKVRAEFSICGVTPGLSGFHFRVVSALESQFWIWDSQPVFYANLCFFPSPCRTSIKYSHAGETDGSRLLLVCDVALGKCMDLFKKDFSLTEAPPGYDSVHGVSKTASVPTDFEVLYFGKHADLGLWVSSQALAEHLRTNRTIGQTTKKAKTDKMGPKCATHQPQGVVSIFIK